MLLILFKAFIFEAHHFIQAFDKMTTPLLSSTTIPKDEDQTGVESFDKPIVRNGRFANPWATWKGTINSWTALFRFLFLERDLSNIPKQEVRAYLSKICVVFRE